MLGIELVESVEVAVDGGAGDAELGGDLGDGYGRVLAVGVSVVALIGVGAAAVRG